MKFFTFLTFFRKLKQRDKEFNKAMMVEQTPLEILTSDANDITKKKAAEDFIRNLIEETDCYFILEGNKKKKENEEETICNHKF